MRAWTALGLGLSLALISSEAVCDEWSLSTDYTATSAQDGAKMTIYCDTEHRRALHPDSLGKILIFYRESGANWTKFEKLEVSTVADDGSRSIGGKSEATALSAHGLVVQNDATSELSVMGKAKNSFTFTAGGFSRTFSAAKFKETTAVVLKQCGDGWMRAREEAMKGFLLLVTWLVENQPPNTTQVAFNSMEACEIARLQVMKDAERMKEEKLQSVMRESQNSGFSAAQARLSAALSAPSVSAACVAQ